MNTTEQLTTTTRNKDTVRDFIDGLFTWLPTLLEPGGEIDGVSGSAY